MNLIVLSNPVKGSSRMTDAICISYHTKNDNHQRIKDDFRLPLFFSVSLTQTIDDCYISFS
jgi:hypothetical protein